MVTVIFFFMITYTPSFICFIVPGIYKKAKDSNQLWIFLLVDYCTFINSTFLPMVHFSRTGSFKRQLNGLKHSIVGLFRRGGKAMSTRTLSINGTCRHNSSKTTNVVLSERERSERGDGEVQAPGVRNNAVHANNAVNS